MNKSALRETIRKSIAYQFNTTSGHGLSSAQVATLSTYIAAGIADALADQLDAEITQAFEHHLAAYAHTRLQVR